MENVLYAPEIEPAANRRIFVSDSRVGIRNCNAKLQVQREIPVQRVSTHIMNGIVRHKLDGRVRKHSNERRRVALQEPPCAAVGVNVARRSEDTRPCTSVGLEVRVGCLKKNLDAVEGRDRCLRLPYRSREDICNVYFAGFTHNAAGDSTC